MGWYLSNSGWEPINTNIPENIGVGSQYWGVSIGVGGVLNKRIDQVLVLVLVWSRHYRCHVIRNKTFVTLRHYFPPGLSLCCYLHYYFIMFSAKTLIDQTKFDFL